MVGTVGLNAPRVKTTPLYPFPSGVRYANGE